MTDKEKLIKIKSLADKMSDTAFNLTTDASLLKKAMDEYHQFIINEYHKEEQIIKALQEEPLSEKKCMFTKDNYTDEDRKVLCEECKEKCEYSKKKEFVNEELEKAVNEWDAKASFAPFYMALDDKGNPYEVKRDYTTHAESFKAGAKWQKEKDDEEKVLTYKHGFEDCKEHMMKDAINGIIRPDDGEVWCNLKSFNFKDGDKCKVILIKEN